MYNHILWNQLTWEIIKCGWHVFGWIVIYGVTDYQARFPDGPIANKYTF